ncbi:response regulator transcription factor [Cohnella rhizosphaerae]|uniref:Heme response regulator HssR n=1 Tax=Cohnella rhizosphaerae TaxID=1457232 RepID=A0A9X4QW62_9BACL|nr:response regulator transcription factor [Cohnella rhizosphaerae]MDG0813490.1 response regulator transcription factor [Cohnella rhizosphaerae]
MISILVADDDIHIRELIALYLSMEGYRICQAKDGRHASKLLETQSFQLAIIDIMMPGKDGWALCREIRERYDLPILMVTAKGESEDRVKGFQMGTDDYVVKPFDVRELILRVKAILRRYKVNATGIVQIGGVTLDARTLGATWRGEPISLAMKEFQLLFKLAGSPGQVFSREQLIGDIWGLDFDGSDRTIDTHVKKLRKKFENDPPPFEIVSIRGLGYRLTGAADV